MDESADSPALARTIAATSTAPPAETMSSAQVTLRSTVLPRIEHVEGEGRLVVAEKRRYETLQRLGAGGQAEVSLARDHDIDRVVAVKRLLPERSDQASVLRFVEEIRAVGQLEHPNIVPIHDVGVDEEGNYYFVMKYVEGATLESIIAELRAGNEAFLRRYTPEYRLQICIEILRGVQHAHELGIVHRDLKPGNVMVGSLGEVAITDWGLAKRVGAPDQPRSVEEPALAEGKARLFQTHAGELLGTPAYMAPEQAAGRLDEVGVRSDLYSLGVMFYEFLSLKHPRAHCTSLSEMIAEVVGEPIGKAQIFRDFTSAAAPAALAHFVRKGVAHQAEDRYPTAAAMRERLEAVRDGRAPIQCHVTFTQRLLSAAGRAANAHPFLLGLVLVGMVAGLVGAGALLFTR